MALNLSRLREYPIVAPDCETTGLRWWQHKCFGIAIAAYDGQKIKSEYYDLRETPRVIEALNRELPHCKRVVNQNVKFDAHFCRESGIKLPIDRVECTVVRAALINEHEPSFSLDSLGLKYLKEGKVDIWQDLAAMFGGAPTRNAQIKNLHRAPFAIVARYAAPDPALAIKLWLWQEKEIECQGLERIWGLERALTPVLIGMEEHGIRVDEERAASESERITGLVARAQREIDVLVGREVNVNSAPQMRELFRVEKQDNGRWYTDKGFMLESTGGGEASIAKESLMIMAEQGDERAKLVTAIRKLLKGQTFLKDHILGHAVDGRVYPNINQTKNEHAGVGPGRLSYDDPAMQQIPMHDRDVAEIVRSCFLPEKGEVWGCADENQFEFRWFAHYTKDENIERIYRENPDADFHQTVADLTGITRDKKYAGDTANAKQINLGLVFGMGQGEMAYRMGMDYELQVDRGGREYKKAGEKAQAVFDKYHAAIPGVRKLLDEASSIARARGWVQTAGGRHIRFPGGQFVHKAGGLVFQGTAADALKTKLVELAPWCKENGVRMLLSVHDELDFSIPKRILTGTKKHIKKVLECFDGKGCPIRCRVPIRCSLATGNNWWESCK